MKMTYVQINDICIDKMQDNTDKFLKNFNNLTGLGVLKIPPKENTPETKQNVYGIWLPSVPPKLNLDYQLFSSWHQKLALCWRVRLDLI